MRQQSIATIRRRCLTRRRRCPLAPLHLSQLLLQPTDLLFELAAASLQGIQLSQRVPGEASQQRREQGFRAMSVIQDETEHRPDSHQRDMHRFFPRQPRS
jgi:hypothetical protein